MSSIPNQNVSRPLPWVDDLVDGLNAADIAVPKIVDTVITIVQAWKAAFPSNAQPSVDLSAVAARIETRLQSNDTFGRAEIERLRAELSQ